jgi:anti-sigma regulatory factor (Ser/Thr protein kinase)
MNPEMALTVRNDVAELERLKMFLADFWAENRLPQGLAMDVTLALEEVFLNVVQHGYLDTAEHRIVVRLALENENVALTVEDDGVPFNPLEALAPNIDLPIEQREVGGLGIHLVQRVMDGMEYARDGGHNRLVMRKRIEEAG